jgi:uncharacterized protein Veg
MNLLKLCLRWEVHMFLIKIRKRESKLEEIDNRDDNKDDKNIPHQNNEGRKRHKENNNSLKYLYNQQLAILYRTQIK